MSYDPPKPATGVVIYGASDDLIEALGEVYDEWDGLHSLGEQVPITVSDGTEVVAHFDHDGIWRFLIVKAGGGNPVRDPHAFDVETEDGRYTDVITIGGPVKWVRVGEPEPIGDALAAVADVDWDDYRSHLNAAHDDRAVTS